MSIIYINSYQFAAAPPSGYDPDAQAYITAVEAADTAAGSPGGLETAVKDAINAFVVGCKADGIWSAINACCILAGARTLQGSLIALKGPNPTNYNFVAADYDRKTGLKGNGSNKRLGSGVLSNSVPDDDVHISTFATEIPASASEGLFGTPATGTETGLLLIGSTFYPRLRIQSGGISITRAAGFVGASRTGAGSIDYRYPGFIGTQTVTAGPATSDELFVFARGAATFSQSRQSFYSFGLRLNLALLDARVTTLMSAFAAAIP